MAFRQRKRKISRLKEGGKPRVLDLFAGCGGLSLGFHSAGFELVGAVEIEPHAAKSHAFNFFKILPEAEREIHARPRDIITTEPDHLRAELNLGNMDSAVDVIIGGPPCQAFSRVGRSKLREVAAHPEAFLIDPRANLYLRYLDYVKEFQPLAILMENVPDALNYGGHNIAEEMCEVLEEMNYVAKYSLLNASFYGVPQMRERMFLIAYAEELDAEVDFPLPTHWIELPRGYHGSRQVALKSLKSGSFASPTFYMDPPKASPGLPPALTAAETLADLPPITLHLEGKLKRGARRFTEIIPYLKSVQISPYAKLMKTWPGFENEEGIADHVIRYLPRDYAIFRRMKPGDQYPQAYQHAMDLFKERLDQLAKEGKKIRLNTNQYKKLKKEIVPPYDVTKFPNKWRKMEADRPTRTLMAHLGKDGYSHIHYDSNQARTISVREAARLQSFPDGFVFSGTMNPAFRQIGEAVPPLMALTLAKEIMKPLRTGEW